MWLKAKTPIKIAPGVTVGAGDPPFEADEAMASELQKLGAVDDGTAEHEQLQAAAAAKAQAEADAAAAQAGAKKK